MNNPTPPRTSRGRASSDYDEDLIEIPDMPRLVAVSEDAPRESSNILTPPFRSREDSQSSAPPPASNKKRSAAQVVDLTLSSDEDEEPPRLAKRQVKFSEFDNNLPMGPNGVNNANGTQSKQPIPNPFGQPPQLA